MPIFRIEIVLLIGTLLEMIRHHNCVLKEKEIRAATELLNLCEGTWWCCGGTDGYKLRELELVLLARVLAVFQILAVYFTTS